MPAWIAVLVLAAQNAAPQPALRGLDPVELVAGREVAGDPAHAENRNGFRYLFANEENGETFEHDATRYEIQMGGACAVEGPLGDPGDADRWLVNDGRIYLFESDSCRERFRATPRRFVQITEPPLLVEDNGKLAHGRELLTKVVAGVGGSEELDRVANLRLRFGAILQTKEGNEDSSEELRYDFARAGDLALTRVHEWVNYLGTASMAEVESGGTLRVGWVGRETKVANWAARNEFLAQTSRELVFLLRQRDKGGLAAWSAGSEKVNEHTLEKLVLNWNGHSTTLFVDPENGHVLRASWRGRLNTWPIGDIVVDFADFEPAGPLVLPHSRTLTLDGKAVEQLSGRLRLLEVR